MLREMSPECKVPTELDPELPAPSMGAPAPHATLYSTSKLEALGMTFTPIEDTIRDTVLSLKHHGFCQIAWFEA